MRYIDFNLDPIVYMSFSKECTEGFLGGCNLKTEPLIIRYKKLTRKSQLILQIEAKLISL